MRPTVHQVIELLVRFHNACLRLVFPWFAIDIGGTLVKLVYFEPLDLTADEIRTEGEILMNIRHFLTSNRAYGQDGVRDDALELTNIQLGGRRGNLHFIRFPTSKMQNFIDLCVLKNLHTLTIKIFATGGGAYKFEQEVVEVRRSSRVKRENSKDPSFLETQTQLVQMRRTRYVDERLELPE